ncbi:MAG: VWA domain-containing protein [Terracidiphilus sp.]
MNFKSKICTLLVACITLAPAVKSLALGFQAFSGAIPATLGEGDPAAGQAADSGLYGDGTRAINDGRWSDAVAIFTKVAGQRGEHADGALYWKAYAENKQGQAGYALDSCVELRRDYPKSRWIDECGALEIEIRSQGGEPVQPKPAESDDVKLLALNTMMQKDELRALPEMQKILENNPSRELKDKVLFVLAQGKTEQARALLAQIRQGKIISDHASPVQQARVTPMTENPAASNAARADSGPITLDVVVSDKSGHPVQGLQAGDFTVFDNKHQQGVTSVRAVNALSAEADPPVELILVIDAINTGYETLSDELLWLHQFLAKGGAQVAVPTSFAILTEQQFMCQDHPTRDAAALSRYLDQNRIGLRPIKRASGYWGAMERDEISYKAFNYVLAQAGKQPGRKLVVWISPGWDKVSDPGWDVTKGEQGNIFANVVSISARQRKQDITVDSIDPTIAPGHVLDVFYERFMKGATEAKRADYGSLLLQVLATLSGGMVLAGSSDLPDLIDQCIADAESYYVLTFNPPPADRPNEYHSVEVKVDKPRLTARTRTVYYSQP